MLVVLAVPNFC